MAPRASARCKASDAITNEQLQKLKLARIHRAPKTVNNVLMV